MKMLKFMKKTSSSVIAAAAFLGLTSQASADIQHLDDVIITFSLCVGNDCNNGESFGFDTMRLKENNLRVHFDDTSSSASFPANDWRIVVNDTSNGGGSYFAIEDSTAGRIPFRVEAGAPANALYVDSGGDVGIGTSTPVVDVHVRGGNTPTLRLDQDGSSGFTAQTWDLGGNESNLFIRDVTHGSTLPFRVEPGAPSNTVYLDSTGRVGMGTTSPLAALDVLGSTATVGSGTLNEVTLRLNNHDNRAIVAMGQGSDGETWRILTNTANSRIRMNRTGSSIQPFTLESNGDVVIAGSITTGSGNTCAGGCDAVFAEDYDLPSIQDHADFMRSNRYLMHVGPTAESGSFNLSEKVGGMLSELEYAHLYIAELHENQTRSENELTELRARLEALETSVSRN
tara:strand:+ start:25427 stop:26623 length:1197 start_codon:yes stop_codon:yes gene_type:complete